MTEKIRPLTTTTKAYEVAQTIRMRGPQTKVAALMLADFGHTPVLQRKRLDIAMKSGWLVEIGGLIHLSEYALHYFDGTEPEQEMPKAPTGSLAEPRTVALFTPMSAKNRPDTRGRREVPDYSVRAIPSTYGKVTP